MQVDVRSESSEADRGSVITNFLCKYRYQDCQHMMNCHAKPYSNDGYVTQPTSLPKTYP